MSRIFKNVNIKNTLQDIPTTLEEVYQRWELIFHTFFWVESMKRKNNKVQLPGQ